MYVVKALSVKVGDVLRRSQGIEFRICYVAKFLQLLHCALVGLDLIVQEVDDFEQKFLGRIVGK